MSEKYRVEIAGEILDPHPKEKVVAQLAALFSCEPARATALLDGRKHTLKTGLDWDTAQRYREAIEQRGAKCDLHLVMDREAFREGLYPSDASEVRGILATAPINGSPGAADRSRTGYQFDTARIFPALFHPPTRATILEGLNSSAGEIASLKASLSYLGALLLSIAAAFFTQWHFSRIWATHVGTGVSGSLLSLGLFFAIILFLPNLIRPAKKLAVTLNYGDKKLAWGVHQESGLAVIHRRLTIETPAGERIARMFKDARRNQYVCLDTDGRVMLKAEEEPDIDDLYLDAVKEVRDELLGLAIVEYAKMAREMVGRMANAVMNLKLSGWKALLTRQTPEGAEAVGKVFVIRDRAGKAKGHVIAGRLCRIVLYPETLDTDDLRLLFGFGLLMAGT